MMLAENDVQDVINDLYTSPQNKKALRQILLVVNDISKGHERPNARTDID